MNSLKRLSPYIGPNIPEEVGENFEYAFPVEEFYRYERGGWVWDAGSGTYQCELVLCDLDNECDYGYAGYVAIVPMVEGVGYTKADFAARIEERLELEGRILRGELVTTLEDYRPKKEPAGYCIRFVLNAEKFRADEAVAAAKKSFESIPQAKAFLDSILAFDTPQIPAPK
jgi:hypothetical protein